MWSTVYLPTVSGVILILMCLQANCRQYNTSPSRAPPSRWIMSSALWLEGNLGIPKFTCGSWVNWGDSTENSCLRLVKSHWLAESITLFWLPGKLNKISGFSGGVGDCGVECRAMKCKLVYTEHFVKNSLRVVLFILAAILCLSSHLLTFPGVYDYG